MTNRPLPQPQHILPSPHSSPDIFFCVCVTPPSCPLTASPAQGRMRRRKKRMRGCSRGRRRDAKSRRLLFHRIFTRSAPLYVPESIRPSELLRGDVAPQISFRSLVTCCYPSPPPPSVPGGFSHILVDSRIAVRGQPRGAEGGGGGRRFCGAYLGSC